MVLLNCGCCLPTGSRRLKFNVLQIWTILYCILKISTVSCDKPDYGRFVGYSSLNSGSLGLIDLSSYARAVPAQDRSDDATTQEPQETTTEQVEPTSTEPEKSIEYVPFPYKSLPVLVYGKKEDTQESQLSYQIADQETLSLGHHIYKLKEPDPTSDHHVFELVDIKNENEDVNEGTEPEAESVNESVPQALVQNGTETESTEHNDTETSSSDVTQTVVESDTKSNETEPKGIQPGSMVKLSQVGDSNGQLMLTAVGQEYQYGTDGQHYYSEAVNFDPATAGTPATPADGFQVGESQEQAVAYQQVQKQPEYQTQVAYQPLDGQIAYQVPQGQIYPPSQVVYQLQSATQGYQNGQGQVAYQYQAPQGYRGQNEALQYQYQPQYQQQAQVQVQYQNQVPVHYQNAQLPQLQYQPQVAYQQVAYQHGQQVAYQPEQPVAYQGEQQVTYQPQMDFQQAQQVEQQQYHTTTEQPGSETQQQPNQQASSNQVMYHDAHGDIVYQDENGQLSYQPKSNPQSEAPTTQREAQPTEQPQPGLQEGAESTQIFVNEQPPPTDAANSPGIQLYYSASENIPYADQSKGFRYEINNFSSDPTTRESDVLDPTENPHVVEIGRRYSEEPALDVTEPTESTAETTTVEPKISSKTDAFDQFLRDHIGVQSSERYQTFAAPPTGALAGFGNGEAPFGSFQGHFGTGGNMGLESAPFGQPSRPRPFGTHRPSFAQAMLETLTGQSSTMNIRGGIFGRGQANQPQHGQHGFNMFQPESSGSHSFGSQLEPNPFQFGGMGGRFTGFQGYEDSLALGSEGGGAGHHFGRLTSSDQSGFGGFPRDRYRHGIRHAHYDVNEQLATESQPHPVFQQAQEHRPHLDWKPENKPLGLSSQWKPEHGPQFPTDWKPENKPLGLSSQWKPEHGQQFPMDWKPEHGQQLPTDWKPENKPLGLGSQWKPEHKPFEWKPEHKPLGQGDNWKPEHKPVWKPEHKPEEKPFGLVGYGNQAVSQAFTANHRARPFKEVEDAIAFLKQIPPENFIAPHRGQFLFRPEEPIFPKEIRNPLLQMVDKQIKEQFKVNENHGSSTPKPAPPPSPIPPPKAMPPPTTPKPLKPPTYHIVHNIMHSIVQKQNEQTKPDSKPSMPIIENGHVYRHKANYGDRIKVGQSAPHNVAINHQGAPIIIYQGLRPPVHSFKKPEPLLRTNTFKPPQALREQNSPSLRATVGKVGSYDAGRSVSYYHRPVYPQNHKPTNVNQVESYQSMIPSRPISKPSLRPPTRRPFQAPSLTTPKTAGYSTVFRYAGFEFPKYKISNSSIPTQVSNAPPFKVSYSTSLKPSESKVTPAVTSSTTDGWTGGLYTHKVDYTPLTTTEFKKDVAPSVGIRRSSSVTEGFGGAGTWIPVAKPEESKYVKAVKADTSEKIMYTPRNA